MAEFMIEQQPLPCRIKSGWENAGKCGQYFGYIFHVQNWAVVVWDGEDDPSFHKKAGLEINVPYWRDAETL